MPQLSRKMRRSLAFHAYAALCALAGVSGLALSLWVHPGTYPAPLVLASDYSRPVADMAVLPTAGFAPVADEFRGAHIVPPGSL